ncbi:MAG: hypothetical protein K8R21_04360, partial [Leptospira sp.]|nr:hypothetical protein [Leptospira sp.]
MPLLLLFISIFLPLRNINSNQDSTHASQLIKAENGLRENTYFISAINSSVSNFGDENDKKLYKRCIQHHIESNILLLQFDLGKSYSEVRHTQELMIQLYYSILKKNSRLLHEEFSRLGKPAIQTGNKVSQHYLQLGLRDLTIGERKVMSAENTRPFLFLLKLKDLGESLKSMKQSGKYAILLALTHESDYPPTIEKTDFEHIKNEINRAMYSKKEKFNRIHY